MADDVRCARCGKTGPGLASPPVPGPPGLLVHGGTCRDCWQAWLRAQVILINERRLSPADDGDYELLLKEMTGFLGFDRPTAAPADAPSGLQTVKPQPDAPPQRTAQQERSMTQGFEDRLRGELEAFRREGVYKTLNHLASPQAARVEMEGRGTVVILSSNNYLGLCDVPEVVQAGKDGLERFGAGTGSVRFICGTFTIHRELEQALATFVGTEASLTYVSCWNANEGLMPAVLDEQDVVISDRLNHASIIDSVRLSKAQRRVYAHSDMTELEQVLRDTASARTRFIITDGVFSMEGDIARLPDIVELARKYDAVVAVDDSHATGVLGETGRGTAEHHGMLGEIDVITSTLGKALGGAAGGFTAGSGALVDYLIQRSRPQLFSNALPPTVAASALAAVRYVERHPERLDRLRENTAYFRGALVERGFSPLEGDTPIVPVIVGETAKAIRMSEALLDEGVFVTGFGYPVVPRGEARVRCQVSAAHSREDLELALEAFSRVGKKLGLVG